ncbi:MAG TPA: GNAT family N-acetyltransferase [Ferruginibacter sp.]|nr:GNAT family N-acetyltransferase [Ferruginibacter sp.]
MSAAMRPFITNDLEDCAKLLMQAYKSPPWRHNWTVEQATKYLTEYAASKQFIGFVLVDKEKIMGAIFAHSKTWWTNEQLIIDELFISPDAQKSGYGRFLLENMEQHAKSIGLKSVTLMTSKFAPSFNFYVKQGYFPAEQFGFLFKEV